MGLFLSKSLENLLAVFPMALVGGMMFLVGLELLKNIKSLRGWGLWIAVVTALTAALTNTAVGFGVGLTAAYVIRFLTHRHRLCAIKGCFYSKIIQTLL